jgi:hypothetical protein
VRSLFFLSLVATWGCALSNVTVTPPAAPFATKLAGGNGRAVMVVAPLVDERQLRNRCGMQKNGLNADTADVICSAEPAAWLADLLSRELMVAGFVVRAAADSRAANAVRLEGRLLQFFVEPKVGAFTFTPEADIHVRLVASSASGLLAERDFYVKGVETSLIGTESNFQSAADEAVRTIVRDMVGAILALMNRYPALGAEARGSL